MLAVGGIVGKCDAEGGGILLSDCTSSPWYSEEELQELLLQGLGQWQHADADLRSVRKVYGFSMLKDQLFQQENLSIH